MDILQVVLIVLLAALAIGAVIWPILRPTRNKKLDLASDQTLAELTAKRDAALRAVKDLEFDNQTGKVSREDFPVYERALKEQAVAAIQAVDDYQNQQRYALAARQTELDATLEAEIAALRRAPPTAAPEAGTNGHPTDALLTPGTADGLVSRFCPQCGRPVQPSDRFCALCGAALVPVATVG